MRSPERRAPGGGAARGRSRFASSRPCAVKGGIRDEARTVSTGGRRGVDATIAVETTTCAKSSWRKSLLMTSDLFQTARGWVRRIARSGDRGRPFVSAKVGGTHRGTVDVSACPTFGGSASDCEESRDGPSNVAKGRDKKKSPKTSTAGARAGERDLINQTELSRSPIG